MVSIALGFSFTNTVGATGHTLSKTDLETFITSATVTSLERDEFNQSAVHLIEVTGSVPSFVAAEAAISRLWYDTARDDYLVENATAWDSVVYGAGVLSVQSYTIPVGTVVKQSANRTVDPTSDAEYPEVLGVVQRSIPTSGVVQDVAQKFGLAPVVVEVPVTAGDLLTTSTAITGAALSADTVNPAQAFTAGLAFGIALDSAVAGTTATVTCLLFG